MNVLYAQIIGAAAVIIVVFSMQCKKKTSMMIVQLISNFIFAIQYVLLNAFSACFMNLVTVLRCFIIYCYEKKKKRVPIVYPIVLSILTIIIGYYTYKYVLTSWISFIPVAITIAYIIASCFRNPRVFRITFMCASFLWLYYNFKVQAYVVFVGNIFEIISTSIALKRYKKSDHKIALQVKRDKRLKKIK